MKNVPNETVEALGDELAGVLDRILMEAVVARWHGEHTPEWFDDAEAAVKRWKHAKNECMYEKEDNARPH